MKKLHTLSFSILLLSSVIVQAQVNKGAILLGGSIGGSDYKTKYPNSEIKQSFINVSPAFGIAIKDNLVLGLNTGFSWGKSDDNSPGSIDSKSDLYSAYIFLRKYKAIGKNGFSIFVQGNAGSSYAKLENNGFASSSIAKRTLIGVSANPGISYAISKKFQLETGFNNVVGINWSTEKVTNNNGGIISESKTNGFDVSTNISSFTSSFYVGFRVLLNKS